MFVFALLAAALCVAVGIPVSLHAVRHARVRSRVRQQHDRAMVSDCLANAGVLLDWTDSSKRRRADGSFRERQNASVGLG